MPYIGQPFRAVRTLVSSRARAGSPTTMHLGAKPTRTSCARRIRTRRSGASTTAAAAAAPGDAAVFDRGRLSPTVARSSTRRNPRGAIDPKVPPLSDPEGAPIRLARPYPLADERALYRRGGRDGHRGERRRCARRGRTDRDRARTAHGGRGGARRARFGGSAPLGRRSGKSVLDVAFGATTSKAARDCRRAPDDRANSSPNGSRPRSSNRAARSALRSATGYTLIAGTQGGTRHAPGSPRRWTFPRPDVHVISTTSAAASASGNFSTPRTCSSCGLHAGLDVRCAGPATAARPSSPTTKDATLPCKRRWG